MQTFTMHPLILLLLTSLSAGASTLSPNSSSPLRWEFVSFSKAIPKEAELSTLYYQLGETAHGEIVGFEPDDDSTTGVTWEYEALSTGQAPSWTRKTDLMFNKPPTRNNARASMISWSFDDKLGSGQGMVLFGGQGSDKKIFGDTWLYRKVKIGAYWFDETENSGRIEPRTG